MKSDIFESWFAGETLGLIRDEPTNTGPGVVMGAPVWGERYIDTLIRYTLPTLLSPLNLAALRRMGARLIFWTDDPFGLWRKLWLVEKAGLKLQIRELPKPVLDATTGVNKYKLLGTAHGIAQQMAARSGHAIHAFCIDHIYADTFFPSLERLIGQGHEAIAHGGISMDMDDAAADLKELMQPDGSLSIPSLKLGDMIWKHLHQQSKAAFCEQEGFAHHNGVMWRGEDAIHIANPLFNTMWLSPRLVREAPVIVPATFDAEGPTLYEGEWYMAAAEDDLIWCELSDKRKAAPDRCDFEGFANTSWLQMNYDDKFLPYFRKRTVIPTSPFEGGTPLATIEEMQAVIVEGLVGHKKRSMEVMLHTIYVTTQRMRRRRTPLVRQEDEAR